MVVDRKRQTLTQSQIERRLIKLNALRDLLVFKRGSASLNSLQ